MVLLNGCLVFGVGVRADHMDARFATIPECVFFLVGQREAIMGAAYGWPTETLFDSVFQPAVKVHHVDFITLSVTESKVVPPSPIVPRKHPHREAPRLTENGPEKSTRPPSTVMWLNLSFT